MKLKLVSTLIVGLFVVSCMAELRRFEHAAKPDGSMSFLVVGDWGRRGLYNQSHVARQLPACKNSVLGNHDYRGNVEAQLSPILRKMDSRWLCLRSFILNAGPEMAEFFFIDTTPFVSKYFTDPEEQVYDWNGILPRKNYLNNLLMEVESGLRESSAAWKIVVGHHTIKSAGHHGNTVELNVHLLPLLQAYQVDFYINGHDHCLEHISSSESGIQFMTSGGGSKAWRGDVGTWSNPQEMKFYHDGQGFMSVEMTRTEFDIKFYDVFGNVLHKWSTSKQLSFAV
ncbi:hypothetical protein V6N11_069138 [Hibiscus sabdariffa]|uniref:acid phosphatase n=1 Tax=Hibiscus sabdariffa TaxID=183260 RepID=A0ABR2A023_9ROSI